LRECVSQHKADENAAVKSETMHSLEAMARTLYKAMIGTVRASTASNVLRNLDMAWIRSGLDVNTNLSFDFDPSF
jgi:hypothetical protein